MLSHWGKEGSRSHLSPTDSLPPLLPGSSLEMEEGVRLARSSPSAHSDGECRACPSLAVVKVLLHIQMNFCPKLELFRTLMGLGTAQCFQTLGFSQELPVSIFKFLIILNKGVHIFIWLHTWPDEGHSPVYTLSLSLSLWCARVQYMCVCARGPAGVRG